MAYAIEQILGWVSLGKMIDQVIGGVPDPLSSVPAFSSRTEDVLGDSARYLQGFGSRSVARLSQYGASAIRRALVDLGSSDVKLIHSFEELAIDALTMGRLRDHNSYEQDKGRKEVARQISQFVINHENLRKACTQLVLANGQLNFDGDGNLLPSSSGQVEQVNFQIPAGNQSQLNVFGAGNILDTGWQLNTTDIPKHIRLIKRASVQLTGKRMRYALYGINVPSYINENDFTLDYLARNPPRNEQILDTADMPSDLFGLTWIPMAEGFWTDQNGTIQKTWGDDNVTFCPDPAEEGLGEWWTIMQGSYDVPSSINIAGDGIAAFDNLVRKYGRFAYGQVSANPPTVMVYNGDTMMPVIKNPKAVFQAVVNF